MSNHAVQDARYSMFRLIKPKICLRLETAHVQPEASETLTQHRANPASTSRSEGLRPDYTHQSLPITHPTVRLLGIPREKTPNHRASPAHRRHAPSSGPEPVSAAKPPSWSEYMKSQKYTWRLTALGTHFGILLN